MLELRTFGGLALRTEGGERAEALAGRTKLLALLAYLAAEAPGGRVPRERLAALLWPGGTDDRARNSLRVALSQLRRAADVPLVDGAGETSLGLVRAHLRADVTAFREALEAGEQGRALELYRGDFLAGVGVEGARPFLRWADERRGHFRREAYEAALSLGASAREAGELAEAEERFRRALDLAPLREEAAGELIRTLAERGRRADAVRLWETFRTRRREELELEPSGELEALVEELKDPAASAPAGSAPADADGPSDSDGPAAGRATEADGEAAEAKAEAAEAAAPEGVGPAVEKADGPEQGGPPDGQPGGQGAGGEAPARRARFRPKTIPGAILAVGLLGAVVASAWHLLGSGDATMTPAGERSVAVLPFEAIGEGDAAFLAEGMHGDLLTRLANVSDLEVTAQTSVERFRDGGKTTARIARELGVRWVVEGGVQKLGDRVQVNAQLIDPRTDTHTWARTYRRELTAGSLFELQGDIAREITRALETRLSTGEEERLYRQAPRSLDAHRFYVRGRSLLEQRHPPEMRRALDYFGQALREDSSYALAWAGIADGLSLLARHPETDPDTLLPRASQAVARALELEPDLAEARAARGRLRMYRRQGPAALRELERAVELRPSYAAAHAWLAKLELSLGRPEEALPDARRAVQLDPMSPENQGTLCWALLALRRAGEALRVARRIAELEQDEGTPPAYRTLALSHLGRADEVEALHRAQGRSPDEVPVLAMMLAEAGEPGPARRFLADLEETRAPVAALLLHAALGHDDRALGILREAYPREEVPWDAGFTVFLRYFWPEVLGGIRERPRFEQFVREMNTRWGLDPDGGLPREGESGRVAGQAAAPGPPPTFRVKWKVECPTERSVRGRPTILWRRRT